MATPGRIVAALATGTQETTLALAQINFDFSLVKFEAPESFHGLGNLLSKKRKVAAECGLSHVTARKLGALFEQLLPKTPRLIDTYGLRASEIAKIAEGGETVRPAYGIFADQAGVDATSIWAAATSGSSAIAMHLLACMLARMFPGPEATSIWAELIDERKKKLNTENPTESHNVSSLLAAHITISRDLLAEWDNSARAWLRVADEAKSLQQTQLLLILKNIHVPVNHEKGNLYQSVIGAWIRALELMEKVLCGASQCVTPYQGHGDLLLALASWHIYPDMSVFGYRTIAQNDSLVPSGAVLTVGLECSPAQQDIGIFWSLPLAHYRFYGPPKVVTRSLCTDSERISLIQFVYVTLGSFLSRWNFKDHEVSDHTKLISRVYDYLAEDHDEHDARRSCCRRQRYLLSDPNWFKYLAEACKGLASCSQVDGKSYNRLVGVGIRRGSKFLGTQPPLFGLSTFDEFFALLRGTEAKIAALRRLIDRYDTTGQKLLIRYRNSAYSKDGKRKIPRVKDRGNFAPYQIPFSSQFFTGNSDEAEDMLSDDAKEDTGPQSLVPDDPILPSVFAYSNKSAEKRDEPVVDFLESGKLPDLPPNGLQRKYGGPENPKWENVSPALLETYDEEPHTGFNMVARHGMVVHLPDGFYSYASAAQEDGYSTKRSWEGTELKYYHHTRWVALHSGGFEREKDCGDGILELAELPLIESHARHIKLAQDEARVAHGGSSLPWRFPP
ncbi:hypothetical protein EJ04DRAFT_487995 [Polyplosphaeria fusca]|uniref:Uncharacterized protein n=1 Tax=Polyplosphaeria fusca TaxID=682080 RepID=A0A9P4V5L1_9PLEO|nr:hypothetical protein EJ04DRAFT_487995 [Polyplosphaeria fusca]